LVEDSPYKEGYKHGYKRDWTFIRAQVQIAFFFIFIRADRFSMEG